MRLGQPRAVHRATVLDDGRVLISGGCTQRGCAGFDHGRRSELFDPQGGTFAFDAVMRTARASGSATLLEDGRVLLAGGYPGEGRAPTSAAEVYDPASATFEPVGGLAVARADHSATLLPDGRVVLAGGFGVDGRALASTEVFDPTTDSFVAGAQLSEPRAAHVAVRVAAHIVLIGGTRSGPAIASSDVLTEAAWSPGPTLMQGRVKLAAVSLRDGRVLVIGGARNTEGRHKLQRRSSCTSAIRPRLPARGCARASTSSTVQWTCSRTRAW